MELSTFNSTTGDFYLKFGTSVFYSEKKQCNTSLVRNYNYRISIDENNGIKIDKWKDHMNYIDLQNYIVLDQTVKILFLYLRNKLKSFGIKINFEFEFEKIPKSIELFDELLKNHKTNLDDFLLAIALEKFGYEPMEVE